LVPTFSRTRTTSTLHAVKKVPGYRLPDLSQSTFPEVPETGFDLVVIGSGPAGESAAVRAAQLGARVAIVEKKSTLGGPTGLTSKVREKERVKWGQGGVRTGWSEWREKERVEWGEGKGKDGVGTEWREWRDGESVEGVKRKSDCYYCCYYYTLTPHSHGADEQGEGNRKGRKGMRGWSEWREKERVGWGQSGGSGGGGWE
jgi:hypothetical protein